MNQQNELNNETIFNFAIEEKKVFLIYMYIKMKKKKAQLCHDSDHHNICRDQDSNLGCRGHNAKY